MRYSHREERAYSAEQFRKQRRDARNKVFADVQDRARRLGYKLVLIQKKSYGTFTNPNGRNNE